MIICLVSCKTKGELASTTVAEVINMACPEDGTCSFEILKNKALLTKTDNLGSVYTEVVDGNHFVLKFEYKKQGNTNYADSGYREEIFIELDTNNLEGETTDLKGRKLFFARWCYCKGQTGYYKINHGKLSVTKIGDKNFQLSLNFKIIEVPQIINEINHTFTLL
ncbi:hypothetical protein [Flavivirga jejuensis]|uniref:Lipoprotein n=1 Tax=Flavivirga jejuensis TaxID=870487 RepID=A0ABT8WRY0_9FLAO|nr:hypothetical protein [Flavivirga jejuensis]MDO5975729.1 hypothetical protein [Flavivirga jejuensis]